MAKKVKIIDLYNVKYDEMEDKINTILGDLQKNNGSIDDVKLVGDSLNKCVVFVVYSE